MKVLFFFPFLFMLGGCQEIKSLDGNNNNDRPDAAFVSEIRLNTAKKLMAEYGLITCGTGSQMMDKIKMIALSFNYYGPVDESKARELLLAAVNHLVSCVNEDKRVHPYLNNFPFQPENVEIAIFIYKKDRSNPALGDLSVIDSVKGVFNYMIDNPDKSVLFTTVLTETYDEAGCVEKFLREYLKKMH